MKKRVLMLLLAGVMAFSMIGCGGQEGEPPENDDQIEDVEDVEDEDGEGEVKDEEEEQPEGEAPSNDSETQQKPADQPTQKPADKPTQKPEQKPSGGGSTGSSNETADGLSSMTLEEIIKKSYGNQELPETGEVEIDASDADSVQWYLGTTDISFKRAVASEALISSTAHSVVAIEVEAGTDVAAVAKKVKENANVRKWVCVEPEQVDVAYRGNIILLSMSYAGNKTIENFKAL